MAIAANGATHETMIPSINFIAAKIERADKHIKEFDAALQAFNATDPYVLVRERDLQAGKVLYRVTKAAPVPLPICAIAGDVLQNLRSALDYMACALVPHPNTGIYFPILAKAPTPDQLKTCFDGKIKGANQKVVEIVASFKPHKGGNDVLWRLHELNRIDKHRLLFAAGACMSRFTLGRPVAFDAWGNVDLEQTLDNTLTPVAGGFPLKEGNQILVGPPPAETDQDMKFLLEVAINEPNVCEGRPTLKVLRESLRAVDKIIDVLRFYTLR